VIESAVVTSKGAYITPDDLPPHITERSDEDGIRVPLGIPMAEAEKIIIRANLNALGGNKSRTSEVLGIGRKTLHRKIHDYGMEAEFLRGIDDIGVST
jgi:DNA-binding NtrC family response regulator